jgi:hypothetical protein
MPVAKVQMDYALNTIPRANVIPALGRDLVSGEVGLTLADLEEQEKVELYLVFDTGDGKDLEQLLMSGYIQRIGADTIASPGATQQHASITISHNLVALASHPAAGVLFTSETSSDLVTLAAIRSSMLALSDKLDSTSPGVFTFSAEYAAASDAISENLPFTPGHLILHFMENLIREFSGEDSNAFQVLKNIKAYDGVDLTNLGIESFTTFSNILYQFAGSWKQGNAWKGLLAASQYMWLHVVPYNTGAYIANPLPILKKPQVALASHEYQMISRDSLRDLKQPIDGIYLTMSGFLNPSDMTRFSTTYPPLSPDNPNGIQPGTQNFGNRYYLQKQIGEKAWLVPYLEDQFGGLDPKEPRGDSEVNRQTPTVVEAGTEKDFREFMQTIGNRVAQYMYGMELLKGKRVRLQLPWRTDLMPGSVVVAQGTGNKSIEFLGQDLYGMVSSTRFIVDNQSTPPQLHTIVELAGVRGQKQNEEFGIDSDPIYEDAWTGVDLFGTFIEDGPATSPYRKDSTGSFDPRNNGFEPVNLPANPPFAPVTFKPVRI